MLQEYQENRITFNVCGELYETRYETLARYPDTLLGCYEKRHQYYNMTCGQYFFNRSRLFFDAILYFYQSHGMLRCPPQVPLCVFEEECRFFQLPEDAINSLRPDTKLLIEDAEHHHHDQGTSNARTRLWVCLNTSIALFSHILIFLSVGFMCVESLPMFVSYHLHNPLSIWELLLNMWFLTEFVCNITCAPNRLKFFKTIMTWVDIAALFPYFLLLAISKGDIHVACGSAFGFFRILRLFRVFRMFHLSRYSNRLRVVGQALRSSLDTFATLFFCMIIINVLGGSFIYFLESREVDSHFQDIPTGIYWATITWTLVGYGDCFPQTVVGRVFATCFMVFGAMTVSIPILTIVAKHVTLHKQHIKDSISWEDNG